MIILEGPDCCGKTTVARVLRNTLHGWSYRWHTRPPKEVPCYAYHGWFIADSHPRIIVDSAHWSGYVYGRTYEDQCQLTAQQWRCEELALMSRGAHILLMIDDEENIRSRWSAREMYPPDKLPQILYHYNDLLMGTSEFKSHLPCRPYKMQDLVTDRLQPTGTLLDIIDSERAAAYHYGKLPPPSIGYGPRTPEFIVAGESPGFNMEPKAPDDLPPSMPWDRGPSSELLWQAFDAIGLRWWQGYYTNASGFDTPTEFGELWSNLARPRVILTVGTKADALVAAFQSNTGNLRYPERRNVLHPSYIHRFHSDELGKWIRCIGRSLQEFCDK